ncbi:MAG: hypothetical protein A2X36_12120 [Elusimicrobia bacterium GWA2_69_24]|nr:MAG: hypothetical protein A2X36_12120 [Elusimicrobia bacterium GWA2_69_24]HBL18872.1 hypothetical protein [Elusimicrobiota bacterium]
MHSWALLAAAVAAGLALLTFCGDQLVDFAASVAEKAGLTPAVIGLTIVAAGTSAPELFVSLTASLSGSPDIAAANVVGSNIANLTLILGLAALVLPIPIGGSVVRLDYPFMLLSSWITLLLCRDGRLDRLEAGFFLASTVAFAAYSVLAARLARRSESRDLAHLVPPLAEGLRRRPMGILLAGLAASIAGLVVGARLLVYGASGAAAALGVSERVIGLTVVAVGTSLPELTACIMAARKGQHEMAVTGLVGSNIFNALFILGVTGLARPIPISPRLTGTDMWVMLGAALLICPMVYVRRRVSRLSGGVLVAGYLAYMAVLAAGG